MPRISKTRDFTVAHALVLAALLALKLSFMGVSNEATLAAASGQGAEDTARVLPAVMLYHEQSKAEGVDL